MNVPEPVLRVRDVSKRFGPTRALDEVSVEIGRGDVHALVGGNGSGKSTLIKVLAGVVAANSGSIHIGGRELDARSITPTDAYDSGLRFVHQTPSTFADLTVAENVAIGHGFERSSLGRIRWRSQRRRAEELIERFEIGVKPNQMMSALSPAKRTMVAIARALQDQEGAHDGVLVLDESTESLAQPDVEALLEALRGYAEAGQSILYVSHRLEQVLAVADQVTVLRDGRKVVTRPAAGLDHDGLAELIAGRAIDEVRASTEGSSSAREVLLEARNLSGGPIKDASFRVHSGEVVGIAGLLGSGRSSLLRMLFGVMSRQGGEVTLGGKKLDVSSAHAAMRRGVALVPEDRAAEAAFPDMSVRENLSMANLGKYWQGAWIRRRAEGADAKKLIGAYDIRAQSAAINFASLSGGNQQKVVLARWMQRNPRLLLLDEPTQGVDIGARRQIHGMIHSAAAQGAATIVVSSDLEELSLLSHRVLILEHGTLREVDREQLAVTSGLEEALAEE